MNISGVLVQSQPESSSTVSRTLNDIAGVEVHAETEDGQLVVTIEADAGAMFEIINSFHDVEGIISTSLIYNHFEDETERTNKYSAGDKV